MVPQAALIKIQIQIQIRAPSSKPGHKANSEAVRKQVMVVVARRADRACRQTGGSCQPRVPRMLASQTGVAHLLDSQDCAAG